MAFVAFAFSLFVDMLWAATISYGAALVASQFVKKPKQRVPNLGGYPIQTSQKAIAIPKVYGCCRVAGNVIWMGPQQEYEKKTHQPHVDGHVIIRTYFKSFTIGIAEGEGDITKIWNGKTLLWTSDGGGEGINNDTQTIFVGPAATSAESPAAGAIRISSGDGTQDARFYTGEAFGKYDDLIWAHFINFETGPTPRIPNFSFEVCTGSSYRYTYFSDQTEIYGVPLFGQLITGLDLDGVAVDIGGGVVSLPFAGHPFFAGENVDINGTNFYDGLETLLPTTTAKELHIAPTFGYRAETFDGSETVCKKIASIGTGAARMEVDAEANIWFGQLFADGTCFTKIEPDGTRVTDALTNNWGAGNVGYGVVSQGDFLYTYVSGQTRKYNRATGVHVWSKSIGNSGFDFAIDADGNAYVGRDIWTMDAVKYDSADGMETILTGFGSYGGLGIGQANATNLVMHVDDTLGILIGGGLMKNQIAESPDSLYNLVVKSLDGPTTAKIALGGTYTDVFNNNTYVIGTGLVQTFGAHIYVLSYTPNPTFYKLLFDGVAGTLTVVDSAIIGVNAEGFYFDSTGTIVVIPDSANADRLWFYDTEFNFLSKKSNLPVSLVSRWGGPGGIWVQGNAIRYPGTGNSGNNDENPATMINDLAQQTRYGAGIAQQYINGASVGTEFTYWEMQDNRISVALTEQLPLMDWVDFILSHCNGYRHWSEGQLHLGAFKDKASIVSLDQDDLVREKGDNPPPPVQIVKRKTTETSNLIELSWIDREKTYDLSVSIAKDDVDRRVSGKVRINPADLTGIKRKELAIKQAYRLLIDGMYRFSIYSFSVGYKDMLYTVGDMIELSDGGQLVNERMLIIAREEDKDGRSIRIEAVEDISGLYPDIAYETEQTLAVPDVPVGSDELVTGTISFREHATAPNLYLFFAPGDSATTGAFIYRSFDNVLYEFVGRVAFDKDTLPNSAGTTTSVLPRAKAVVHRYSESFAVDIGDITSLRTDVSDDEFFQNQSLIKIGDEILAFKTAEDQGSGVWKLTQTIRGLFGTEAVAHPVGSVFATVSLIDLFYGLSAEVAGQVIYFKALATATGDVSQTLDNVGDPTEYTVIREHQRPYPLSIQGVKDAGGLCTVDSFPVMVEFNLASKEAGFNLGGFGEVGWGNFVKDSRIVGINVRLKTLIGDEIVSEYHSLEGYHASDYELTLFELDRMNNDPFIVEMSPVASLPSSKVTANMIDVVT